MLNCCKINTTETDQPPVQLCPIHQQYPLERICVENRCLEPLCKMCEADHQKIHQLMDTGPKLMRVEIVSHYCLEQCQRELRELQSSIKISYEGSPKELIMDMVDEFFLGNSTYRLQVLKLRQKVLLNKPSISSLINILLEDNKYIVPKNFEDTLSVFLDKNLIFNNI